MVQEITPIQAINTYLDPALRPQKGQLVIKDQKLVCQKLTNLEKVGKAFGIGPAAANQVLRFINTHKIQVKDLDKLQYKLEKHTISGFIKRFFYPKPAKTTESTPTPSNLQVPAAEQVKKSPYLKIGDEIELDQSPMQQIRSKRGEPKCKVIDLKYDQNQKDMVYTLERVIIPGDKTKGAVTERWSESHKTLFPDNISV